MVSEPFELHALVVEAYPGLHEVFRTLLEGWSLQFVQDPWARADHLPADVNLLVIDEDYPGGPEGSTPPWLKSLSQRLPTLVLRTPPPFSRNPATLILPKPFTVSFFVGFADLVRQHKLDARHPPEGSR